MYYTCEVTPKFHKLKIYCGKLKWFALKATPEDIAFNVLARILSSFVYLQAYT